MLIDCGRKLSVDTAIHSLETWKDYIRRALVDEKVFDMNTV